MEFERQMGKISRYRNFEVGIGISSGTWPLVYLGAEFLWQRFVAQIAWAVLGYLDEALNLRSKTVWDAVFF